MLGDVNINPQLCISHHQKIMQNNKMYILYFECAVSMVIKRVVKLKFFKINYLNSLFYYNGNKEPRDIFHEKIKDFFQKNFKKQNKFEHLENYFQICALEIGNDFIFGKVWKLKEKLAEDFHFDGYDYVEEPFSEKDYVYNFFYISLKTNHIVIQHQNGYSSGKVRYILEKWYDDFYKIENGIVIQTLKDKKDFIKRLIESYKIIYAKFIVYPSNFDYDDISKPFDESLHKRRISKLTEIMESKEGMDLDLEKPNIVSMPLAQSLRGNGKDPVIKTQDRQGRIRIISQRLKHIMRQIEETDDIESIKNELKNQLLDVLSELND